ncbi:alginate lyase family protein [Olivibacter domesticus]|uniref:Alginate lyase n=1 Tax=Olivibacter domesticus TaxID=407022 RepID=A0A1H7QF71_OLID1|nr:alginate lyase family protein [Olivibacter domesticus]SEL46583.1 Alginate lyase [Olivibacter domesticus]
MRRFNHYITYVCLLLAIFCISWTDLAVDISYEKQAAQILGKQILQQAQWAMQQQPITVTAETSPRSAGGKHDFFSEGDYWWPDPVNPNGPYVQKDGMTNPANFVAHRRAMIRFSQIIGALAAAYKLTSDEKYIKQALTHLEAWFVNPQTLMHPNLLYAQAIKGRFTGRGIGIIDTIHLMEVAQGILVMKSSVAFPVTLFTQIKGWFSSYLKWLTTHPYGLDEMNAENNHGTCWTMQVASFAKLTGDEKLLNFCRERYKEVLLPNQMDKDGAFPRELKRTKPYGYSLFNLDAMVMLCQILSTPEDNLWNFQLVDGRSIKKGMEFMFPYVENKANWPYPKDVMYWDNWPVAQPSLLFSASAYKQKEWFDVWLKLDHKPQIEELIRNLPIRNPIIWF